jgi:adenosylcobinamide kinase/adenosylcobinamide-phosphate guanylyltransferase
MIVLFLGGARSGKSQLAERRANSLTAPITYIATAALDGDPDFAARVAVHRARRPASWATVEAGADLSDVLPDIGGTVLIDSLGTWLAQHHDFEVDAAALTNALQQRTGDAIVVSEEVGLGVHPSTELGRRFRDALGTLNQAVADVADEAFLVVAGRLLSLRRPA